MKLRLATTLPDDIRQIPERQKCSVEPTDLEISYFQPSSSRDEWLAVEDNRTNTVRFTVSLELVLMEA